MRRLDPPHVYALLDIINYLGTTNFNLTFKCIKSLPHLISVAKTAVFIKFSSR